MTPVRPRTSPAGSAGRCPDRFRPRRRSTIPLESRVENLATGREAARRRRGRRDHARHRHRRGDHVAEPRRADRHGHRPTVTPSIPAVSDRRRVTVYELAGPRSRSGARAFPRAPRRRHRLPPRPAVDAETVEVGRTIARGEYQPGSASGSRTSRPAGPSSSATPRPTPSPGTVDSAAIVGSTVSSSRRRRTRRACASSGSTRRARDPVTAWSRARSRSGFALSSAKPALVVRIGEVGPRTLALAGTRQQPHDGGRVAGGRPPRRRYRAGARRGPCVLALRPRDRRPGRQRRRGRLHRHRRGQHDGGRARPRARSTPLTTRALRSAPLPATVTLSNPTPQVAVTIGPVGPRVITPPSGHEPEVARRLALGGDRVGGRGAPVPPLVDLPVGRPADRLPGADRRRDRRVPRGSTWRSTSRSTWPRPPRTCSATSSPPATARRCARGAGQRRRVGVLPALRPEEAAADLPAERAGGRRRVVACRCGSTTCSGRRCPGLYRRPPTAEVFATRTQDDGFTAVQFGDRRDRLDRPDRHGQRPGHLPGRLRRGRARSRRRR